MRGEDTVSALFSVLRGVCADAWLRCRGDSTCCTRIRSRASGRSSARSTTIRYTARSARRRRSRRLQYLPFLIDRSAPDAALLSYLSEVSKRNTGVLDAISAKELPRLAWAEDKTRAEEAVEVYLVRCMNGPNWVNVGEEGMSVDEPS